MGDEMFAEVCELAFEVAKEGDAPSAMKNYLYLAHRPPRAYSVAQRALEEEPGFRARVAERATIENVGEAGYLWLHRPEGWERRFAALNTGIAPIDVASPATADRPPMPEPPPVAAPVDPPPAATVDSIEVELSSLRNLVDRLADERQNVRSSVSELEAELETRRAENLAMSTDLSALRSELSAVQADQGSVAEERDAAVQRAAALETKIAELEGDVASLTREVDRLASELASSNAERDGALADLASVSADLAAVSADLASVSTDRDEKAAALTAELAVSEERMAELSAANARLTEDNTELASRVVVAEQARVDLEGQLGDVSAKWQEAARELAGRSRSDLQLDAAIHERDQLRRQLGEASEQLARVRSAVETNHEQLAAALTEAERAVAPIETAEATRPDTEDIADVSAFDASPFEEREELDVPSLEIPTPEAPSVDGSATVEAEPDTGAVEDEMVSADDEVAEPATADEEPEPVVEEPESVDEPEPVVVETVAAEADAPAPSEEPSGGRTRITVPDDLADEVEIARHVVSTPDVVLLIDGDGAAGLGWPHLDVAARRSALVNYLGQLTADTGAAADVVFERPVGGEDALPVSRAVRVRIADLPVGDSPLFPAIIDGYPEEWPIAVVSDESAISERAGELQVTHLGNGQLLDLFLYLSSND